MGCCALPEALAAILRDCLDEANEETMAHVARRIGQVVEAETEQQPEEVADDLIGGAAKTGVKHVTVSTADGVEHVTVRTVLGGRATIKWSWRFDPRLSQRDTSQTARMVGRHTCR